MSAPGEALVLDCVFVDDQLRNVNGAAAAGMHAIHLDVRDPAQGFARALALLGVAPSLEPAA